MNGLLRKVILAFDAGFRESDHPRDKSGKFGGGGGGSTPVSGSASGKSFADYQKAAGGDHYKAAQEFYKSEMMGKPAKTKIDGKDAEVHFGGGQDKKKMWQDLERDPVRAESLQHVRDVLEGGKYLGRSASGKTDDRFVSYHYFQKEIPMKDENGKPRKLIVDVGKRKDGAMEYRAHSFIHNKEPHYAKKVETLRGGGVPVEDKAIKKDGRLCQSWVSRPNKASCPPAFDENIVPPSPRVKRERIAFDKQSARAFDANGFLHVAISPISKEQVAEYYGSEIPGWREEGLDPNRIYKGYRPGPELEKAASTFNGLNILSEHIKDDAEEPAKEYIIGSMGTDAGYSAPYLKNSLIIKDAEAIGLLSPADPSKAPRREISASYRYDPVFKAGTFNNDRYDFIMTNIRGNHIALVEEGRAGSDVVVSDSNPVKKGKGFIMANPLQIIEDLIASLKGAGVVPHDGGEEEAKKFMEPGAAGAVDEDPAAAPAEPVAEDDALESALTELFALADSVQDEELAGKLKAVGESIRQSQGGAPSGDEDPEAPPAEDEDTAPGEEKKEEKMASDRKSFRKGHPVSFRKSGNVYNINLANDAAIASGVEARMNAKFIAAREVRGLIGEIDPLAFDSAAGIYRAALKARGTETRVGDVSALRQMVKLAMDARPRDVYPVVAALANDSRGKDAAVKSSQ